MRRMRQSEYTGMVAGTQRWEEWSYILNRSSWGTYNSSGPDGGEEEGSWQTYSR